MMSLPRIPRCALPLQVAAVCYRRVNSHAEFLLVNTNGGNKWTFPKGAPEPRLSHSQAAEREAKEEAGAIGVIEPRHFHIYVHSKGVFWQPGEPGVRRKTSAIPPGSMREKHALSWPRAAKSNMPTNSRP